MSPRPISHKCVGVRFCGATAITALLAVLALVPAQADTAPPQLTSRARPPVSPAPALEVGKEVKLGAGQRQRFALSDGSLVYVNEGTALRLDQARQLTLQAGEVFIEAAGEAPLVVKTPQRQMTGRQVQFGVRAQGDGTGIVVARGQLSVGGLEKPVQAGQQLMAGSGQVSAAGRVSHTVDWTRELMSDTALVPASPHAGGAIVAVDPAGQKAKLSLRKYHVDVHIEDGFARTTIDQTHFNHESQRLEGTFYFPLPADASLCRLAMYVDGKRMEGGMTERDYARSVYESIVYRQRDPALLEWVDGTTFKMRVFPLEARQEKRIILSYTQKLPSLYGQWQYRFPAGHSLGVVRDWSAQVRVKDGAERGWSCASHTLKAKQEAGDLLLTAAENHVKLERDLVLVLTESKLASAEGFSSVELDGARYLMVRCRPALAVQPERQRRDWIFLCETSADREPLLARTQIEMVRSLLHRAEPDDRFLVVAANTQLRTMGENGWLTSGPQLRPITDSNIQAAIGFLENAHLIGAFDLGRALTEIEPYWKPAQNPHLVHLGSGIAAMGERRDDVLAKKIPDGVRYVGIAVGKRWSRTFMKAAAERTGGYFTQLNPDEPISWRAFDLSATLDTPRLLNIQVADPAGKVKFLADGSSLAQGEEICAVARTEGPLPETVIISGQLGKEPWQQMLPVKNIRPSADHVPRTWAKLEIDRLLADISRDPKAIKQQVIELSKQMYVMTPFTSLLVLENEAMYDQYKVDRSRKDHWAMYACPDQIPVVYEPLPGMPASVKEQVEKPKPTPAQVRDTIQVRSAQETETALQRIRQRFIVGDEVTPDNTIRRRLTLQLVDLDAPLGFRNEHTSFGMAIPPFGGFPNVPPSPAVIDAFAVEALTKDVQQVPAFGRRGPGFVSGGEQARLDLFDSSASMRFASPGAFGWFGQDATISPLPSASLMGRLLNNSEDLRVMTDEWERIHFTDAGHRLQRVHGGISTGLGSLLRFEKKVPQLSLFDIAGRPAPDREVSFAERLIYRRPSYSNNDRIFFDLVAYAPGMNTAWPDILAQVDAETVPSTTAPAGTVDTAARKLIEQARAAAWQSYEIEPGWTVHFDGAGRYRWERTIFPGIREQVVCDGQIMWHLYPDLGIGARRTVSRFHQSDFARLIPWVLPKPEDMARGTDLVSVDARTVAVVPAGSEERKDAKGKPASYVRVHLVFDSGRLVERQLVEMPAKKILTRQTLSADGTIRLLDADGKEVALRKVSLRPAQAPSLKPDVKQLVVLPLPYRTPEHVRQRLEERQIKLEDRPADDALPLLAAEFAKGNTAEALKVFQTYFHARNQRQLGFYVLLAACGQNLAEEPADVLAEHPAAPVAQYLALYSSPVLRKHASQWAVSVGQWDDGFLKDLAVTHTLLQRWQNSRPITAAERDRAVDYVRKHAGMPFAWSLLTLMQDRSQADAEKSKEVSVSFATLAELFGLFAKTTGLSYAARYEQARCLWAASQQEPARQRFRALYAEAFQDGMLPIIDSAFRTALLQGKAGDSWGEVMRGTADRLIKDKRRLPVLVLAWQCWQLEDGPLAEQLLHMALANIADDKERFGLTLAGIGLLKDTGQLPQADQLLAGLLADSKHAELPALWRLAAELAGQRELKSRELHCLEKALAGEYRNLPEMIDANAVRSDYRRLLGHYENLAEAMVSLGVPPPPDFLARVISAADRWRALDSESTEACQQSARILQALGRRELAWDYLTTPIGLKPSDAEPWSTLAQSLQRRGERELADRAFAAAFEMEPTNAQYLWDRAQNLRQAGKLPEAQQLLRKLAEGDWQPRFEWLKEQARRGLPPS